MGPSDRIRPIDNENYNAQVLFPVKDDKEQKNNTKKKR